jgi:16S rRNA (guanine527-N7)-methyltransferase
VIDAGTGGGFPGIPLAILFPETRFTLVDSIGKKVRLVREICIALDLKNVTAIHDRVEKLGTRADFVVSRAVTAFPVLYRWTSGLIRPGSGDEQNGLIALKGGNLQTELASFKNKVELHPISGWFQGPFFSEKTIVYLKK